MRLHRFVFVISIFWAGFGIAADCPPGRDQVSVRIIPSVHQDTATGLFVYRYIVESSSASRQEVDRFAVDYVGKLSQIRQPEGWDSGRYYTPHAPEATRKVWGFAAMAVAEPHRIRDDASVPPSIVQIKPGDSLAGFGFSSANPPGPVRYYVTGFMQLPVQVANDPAQAELLAEKLMATCQTISKPILQQGVTGITVGPVEDSFTPVALDIKPGSFPNAVNPDSHGVIPVALLGNASFDVTQVDQATVRFGSGETLARHKRGHFKDVNNDGFTDLVLHFPTQQSGIRCGDGVVFLKGATFTDIPLQGFDSIQPVSCK